MKHVLEKRPARAIFPRPPQVNAEASSSKVKLPGPTKPGTRTSPTSTAYGTDEPVKFPRNAASKPSVAPVLRASSLARTKDPFSKDFIRTDTESDGSAKAAVEKGKTKAKLMIDRRQTFSGVPPLDTVPHLDLANEVRKREHQRSNGRQSAPLIDLRARRASLAASRSSTSASDEHRPRRNSTPSAFSFDQGPRRPSSIASSRASAKPTSVADMRRLSARARHAARSAGEPRGRAAAPRAESRVRRDGRAADLGAHGRFSEDGQSAANYARAGAGGAGSAAGG
ncbi:hypothetical protein EWM64_g8326 [Hericium alpestre]|uniref:Uncharacterized protein n=1 Tax=Hericium alpestre TaxID=135208 RepID=A0A4Y9ZNR7_9AGAM|nr:hypothetical protein EWM64_g8326 [Hericium alpestre]